ncbi:hypothetical protein [Salmonella sp. s54925]|uniref:hypothetical protein n=1 Tax=Salmonella sp. s54925 TaxID=3159674 RepID=UPI00397F9790
MIQGEVYWTGWLNRDSPLRFGDFETYRGFKYPPCAPSYSSIDAKCRLKATKRPWYTANKVIVKNHGCSARGLACRNRDQPNYLVGSICCPDFEIKFLCHTPDFTMQNPCILTNATVPVIPTVNANNTST